MQLVLGWAVPFNVAGRIKWLEDTRSVLCGDNKVAKSVRLGLIADETGSIKISVWGSLISDVLYDQALFITSVKCEHYYGLRLSTIVNSTISPCEKDIEVDWERFDLAPQRSLISCPNIESVKVNSFLECEHRLQKKGYAISWREESNAP